VLKTNQKTKGRISCAQVAAVAVTLAPALSVPVQ